MWPFRRRFSPSRAAEQAGRMVGDALAEGIRQGQALLAAGEPIPPLSDEAIAFAERASWMFRCEPGTCEVCDERRNVPDAGDDFS
jgi:hypothetical protein